MPKITYGGIGTAVAILISLGSLYVSKLSYDLAVAQDKRALSEKSPAIDIQMQPIGVTAASMVVTITNRSSTNITPLTITAVHTVDMGTLFIESPTQSMQLMRSTLSLSPMGTIKPKGTATMRATLAGATDGTRESERFTPGAEVQFSVQVRMSDEQDTVQTFDILRRVRLP